MLRRSLLLALLTGALAADARAQTGPGTIYYGFNQSPYRISGDGMNNLKLWTGPPRVVQVTSLATYPGGRQLAGTDELGTIPGTSLTYGDLILYSETDATLTTVTNFRGPQYLDSNGPRIRFSNDLQDSFFSFLVYDTRISRYYLVRYNGPIADIFEPDFVPFTTDDPRLEYVSVTSMYDHGAWDPTGTKLTYWYKDSSGRTVIWYFDTTNKTSTPVNNPAVSGLDLSVPWCSPTEFRYFGPATDKRGTKGIVSFYPATGQWGWVIKEGGPNKLSSFSSVAVSPDGTTLAFGVLEVVSKQIVNPSLVRMPASGGSYTRLVTYSGTNINSINAGGLGWKW